MHEAVGTGGEERVGYILPRAEGEEVEGEDEGEGHGEDEGEGEG